MAGGQKAGEARAPKVLRIDQFLTFSIPLIGHSSNLGIIGQRINKSFLEAAFFAGRVRVGLSNAQGRR